MSESLTPPRNLATLTDLDVVVYRTGFAGKDKGEPLSYKLQSVKTVMEAIYNTFPEAPYHKGFLSGKTNFRNELATIKVYKGNRDPQNKPEFYEEIRQYLIDYHGAVVTQGQEADDAIAQEQWSNKDRSTVAVTIDKDILKGVPGWMFNWVKGEIFYTTKLEADVFLFRQMLEGDSTDNIVGIKGVGPKTIDKMFAGKEDNIDALREIVQGQYRKQYGDKWESAYNEIGNLLYIRRVEGEECPFLWV